MRDSFLAIIAVGAFGSMLMLMKIHFDLDMLNWLINNGYTK